ncbi:MAG: lamin tail domain-containing protein [Proteobacteria bacterium]|nr:lamin tail domain-containing protein [Pseudomonadota bacterium]MBU1715443.1 lamin tail domain-containing protein [Pseudomonadota bacterium]
MKKAAGLLIILLVCMGMSTNVTWAAFTHTLENTGCGGGPYPNNALFQIVGDELRTNAVIQQEDYPAGCTICIRTNDGAGGTYDEEFVITINNIPPSVTSIVRANGNPTNAATIDFTVTFRESVTGVDTGDFSLTTGGGIAGASVDSVSGGGTTYTVTVDTGIGSGTIRLDLSDNNSISDGTDFLGPGDGSYVAGEVYTIDKNAPGITSFTRLTPASSPTNADNLIFRATFDQDVQNVDVADFSVTGTNATITGVVVVTANTVFDLTVSGGDLAGLNGVVGINVSGTQNITDSVGNPLPAGEPGTDETYLVDNTAPSVTSIDRANPTPTNANSVNFIVTFDGLVNDIETGDFVVATTGTASGSVSNVSAASGSVVTVTVNTIAGDGTLGLNFDFDALDNILDAAGNAATADSTGQIYTIDNTAPTVTINQAVGQNDPATSTPINFTVTFNENVTGFDIPADVTLSGTAAPTTAVITGTGPYNVAVSGMSSIGTIIAEINSAVAQDLAGNTNAASTSTDNQVTYTPPPPSVTSINRTNSNPTNAASVDFTVTFDQSVSGIDISDFSLATSGTTGNIASVSAASGSSVTVTVNTITGDGTLGLNMADNDTIVNALSNPLGGVGAGNGNFTGQLYTIDRVGPTVTNVSATTADGTYYIGDTIDITVQFDESVTVTGGPPTLTLETGATDAVADYSSGSPSATLTFTYTVLQSHTSADLDYLNTAALAAGGGTIRDAQGNDAVLTLVAPGAANSLGANKALAINGTPRLVINEIDYNQGATDTAEFIEIKNVSGAAVILNGYALLLVDSAAGPGVYQTINLANVALAAGDYYVICNTSGSTVGNCDQSASLGDDFIQDGSPDAIKLVKGIAALDTVSYDGDTAGYTETTGAPADNDISNTYGLSRFADGLDTNDNSTDFTLRCISPGGTNSNVAPPGVCNNSPVFTGTPAISGSPIVGQTLSLINTATSDPDGDLVTRSYQWQANGGNIGGAINATYPLTVGDAGKTITCAVTADDGQGQGNSTVTVITAGVVVQPDSDGDGVPDGSDLCPGGNDNIDIDNDGIPDGCDPSLPLPLYTVISSAGAHGTISPRGNLIMTEGDSAVFTLTPETGYLVAVLDSTCGGTLTDTIFTTAQIMDNCTVTATFELIPDRDQDGTGDSDDAFPDDPALFELGISQVDFIRVDGGDSAANLVDDKPKLGVVYQFRATIDYPAAGNIWLLLNGYPQKMNCGPEPVDFNGLVECTFETMLGPAGSQRYQVEIREMTDYNPAIEPLVKSNEIPGPAIELLNGSNMVGLAKALADIGLEDLLGSNQISGWLSHGLSTTGNNGEFELYDNSRINTPGHGYFIKRQNLATLPDLSQYPEHHQPEFAIEIVPGWNMIANPYGGQVLLDKVKIQRNDENPVSWSEACAANYLVNAIYSYQGDDWGKIYNFESEGGSPEARIIPWLGYWIYVVRDDAGYKLIIPKPTGE